MNKNFVEKFYSNKYTDYKYPAPTTFLARVYTLLKRFELHRSDASVNLLTKGNTILDIGSGAGDILIKASEIGYKNLYGIDVSGQVVKQCSKRLKSKKLNAFISVQNIDEGTNYKSSYFDAITIIATLEHVFSPIDVLKEIKRILKPSGQLIIEVPNMAFLPRRLSLIFGRAPTTSDEGLYKDGHLQYFSKDTLVSILEKEGFKILKITNSGIGYKFRDIYPPLLGANIIVKAIK